MAAPAAEAERSPDDERHDSTTSDAAPADAGLERTRFDDTGPLPFGSETASDAGSAILEDAAVESQKDASAPVDPSAVVVRVRSGLIQGTASGGTREFLGIPYASPPVGPRRFAPALPVESWSGVRMANADGPECWSNTSVSADEDCLTLNVFAPTSLPRGPAPVMVFIHGGGFDSLSKNLFRSYPKDFYGLVPGAPPGLVEAGGVVLVAINYRLSALAQLVHPELDKELGVPSGNLSIRDQQLALAWVRDNIAAFGGDPKSVTLFGQSAGGLSTCAHLFARGSERLAQRFIIQSGGCFEGRMELMTRQAAINASNLIIAKLCPQASNPLTCLRSMKPEAFTTELTGNWLPNVDHELFGAPLKELARQGKFQRAPVLIGSNANEFAMFGLLGYGAPQIRSVAAFRAEVTRPASIWPLTRSPSEGETVYAHYRPTTDAQASEMYAHAFNHEIFRCPARALARALSAKGSRVHLYSFEVAPGAHMQECDYIFGFSPVAITSSLFPLEAPLPPVLATLQAMQAAWTNFAWTGDPNGPTAPPWPTYEESTDSHAIFGTALRVGTGLAREGCDFWDDIYAKRR